MKYLEITSDAYFKNVANGNNSTWVSDVYQGVLGRPADTQGLSHWVSLLAARQPRQSVAANLAFSTEALQGAVNDAYHQILGRNADTGGISFWANGLKNGMTEVQLQVQLALSPEYAGLYAKATLPLAGEVDVVNSRVTCDSSGQRLLHDRQAEHHV